jgi:glycosyltransferase involved in cell wall biosynthesis
MSRERKKLKVGIFTEVYHPTINGVVVSIDTFKSGLADLGVESVVFAPASKGNIPRENVVRIPSLPFHPDYPLPLPPLYSDKEAGILRSLDLIHTQHPFIMGWWGLALARRLGIPIVTTYHTLLSEYVKNYSRLLPFGPRLMQWLSWRYCNKVDLSITPSPSMREILKSYGVSTRIEVNPTGILPDTFQNPHPNIHGEFGIPKERQILLYVGRLANEKNIRLLLTAFSIVSHQIPHVHLILVGDGPQRKEYERLCERMGINPMVTFAGFLPKEKTNTLFGAVDVFVFPSTTDTQGIVIAEAMAAGTPIVAVDALGPGDIIEHEQTGLLCDNDATEFALSIIRVLGNQKLANKLGGEARRRAHRYSVKETAKKQLAIYQSVLSPNSAPKFKSKVYW